MDLTAAFIEKIESMVAPVVTEIDGLPYSQHGLRLIQKPMANTLCVKTLDAFVGYVRNHYYDEALSVSSVHIVGPGLVRLLGPLSEDRRDRETFVVAEAPFEPFAFGSKMDIETFIINLKSQFVENEGSVAVLGLVSNLSKETKVKNTDDGITQALSIHDGFKLGTVIIPDPLILKPYRTFIEVEQPSCSFILRISDGPRCALYEADGGLWRLDAVMRIREYLLEAGIPAAAILA